MSNRYEITEADRANIMGYGPWGIKTPYARQRWNEISEQRDAGREVLLCYHVPEGELLWEAGKDIATPGSVLRALQTRIGDGEALPDASTPRECYFHQGVRLIELLKEIWNEPVWVWDSLQATRTWK